MFLFEGSSDISFGTSDEFLSTFSEKCAKMFSKLSTSEIISLDTVRKRVSLENWNGMGNTISSINNATGSSTRRVKGKDSLDRNVELWDLEILKENRAHSFSIFDWVSWGFGKHGGMVFRLNSKFVEVAVMPNFLHIFPVLYDTVSNWIVKSTDTSFGYSIFSNIFFIFLSWSNLFIF